MKTVLITGAAGFLGCNLVRRYLNDGWFVIGFDDFTSSSRENKIFVENNKYEVVGG